jgi:glutathione S-transferase
MALVILIIMFALIEYIAFSFQVGMAREKYGVKAPAVSGHPEFDKYFRVQQNTLEQLVIFIPAILAFSWSAENIGWPGYYIASFLGVIWLIGRFIYGISYVNDPAKRSAGFLLSFFPSVLMIIGTLVSILLSLI